MSAVRYSIAVTLTTVTVGSEVASVSVQSTEVLYPGNIATSWIYL